MSPLDPNLQRSAGSTSEPQRDHESRLGTVGDAAGLWLCPKARVSDQLPGAAPEQLGGGQLRPQAGGAAG